MSETNPHGIRSHHYDEAEALMADAPRADMATNYNLSYADELYPEVVDGVALLLSMPGVASLRSIREYGLLAGGVASGQIERPIVRTGGCNENITPLAELDLRGRIIRHPQEIIDDKIDKIFIEMSAVASSSLAHAISERRDRGQGVKPRSNETESVIIEGKAVEIPVYGGDGVNSEIADPDLRQPHPRKFVEMAIQADSLERRMQERTGKHIWAHNEVLLIPYILGMTRIDPATGMKYYAGADAPWVGVRTGRPDGVIPQLMAGMINVTGAKIGPATTAEDILGQVELFNPHRVPGKYNPLLRLPTESTDKMEEVADAIAEYDPHALILNEVHGIQKTSESGKKIRCVEEFIENTAMVASILRKRGLKLHGVALETIWDDSRLEWVDHYGQEPTHNGNIDPQLNPRQTVKVLDGVAPYLL